MAILDSTYPSLLSPLLVIDLSSQYGRILDWGRRRIGVSIRLIMYPPTVTLMISHSLCGCACHRYMFISN